MRRTRAIIYLVAGLVCASVSVFAAYKYVSRGSAGGQGMDQTQVLVAVRQISQGEPLKLAGDGEGANAAFVNWPSNCVPEGAFLDRSELQGSQWRLRVGMVKNEPILQGQIVQEQKFVPEDMYLQMVKVDPGQLSSGRLRLGMRVDVMRVEDNRLVPFMNSAEIYAIGRLDERGMPVREEEPPPNVWLLVSKEHRAAFLQAEYNSQLLLVESTETDRERPYLVDDTTQQERQAQRARSRLEEARRQAAAGDFVAAADTLQAIRKEYPDVAEGVLEAASKEIADWRRRAGEMLYEQARVALDEEQDFSEALRLLRRLEQDFSDNGDLLRRAQSMRAEAQKGLEANRRQVRFQAAVAAADQALKGGNLPVAREKLKEMEKLVQEGIESVEGFGTPEGALVEYRGRISDKAGEFQVRKQALELFLKRGDLEAAREKMKQIQDGFPAHPETAQLESKLQQSLPEEG